MFDKQAQAADLKSQQAIAALEASMDQARDKAARELERLQSLEREILARKDQQLTELTA